MTSQHQINKRISPKKNCLCGKYIRFYMTKCNATKIESLWVYSSSAIEIKVQCQSAQLLLIHIWNAMHDYYCNEQIERNRIECQQHRNFGKLDRIGCLWPFGHMIFMRHVRRFTVHCIYFIGIRLDMSSMVVPSYETTLCISYNSFSFFISRA